MDQEYYAALDKKGWPADLTEEEVELIKTEEKRIKEYSLKEELVPESTKKVYVCNAFSLSMLDRESQEKSESRRAPIPISEQEARSLIEEDKKVVSAVGHADTARIFSAILNKDIQVNRVSVKLTRDDLAIVGQYIGPRLPEGATQLPEGATIEWWLV